MDETVDRTSPARVLNALLGAWLFLSGFVWDHTPAQRVNAWGVGVLCMAVALVARAAPPLRRVNTALAAWLLASVWVLPHASAATTWNDGLVAVAILALSLVAGRSEEAAPPQGAQGAPG
jgi:hypothetical protein